MLGQKKMKLIIVNIELWEMDNDWNFVSSETISKNLDDESINPEYQLQELTFDTDFDKDGDVGNGYLVFTFFSTGRFAWS